MPTLASGRGRRDPAWRGRVATVAAGLALLWPLMALSHFQPWLLFDAQSLQAARIFLGGMFPPRVDAPFLLEVGRAAWVTIAIATAGMFLATLAAIPFALVISRALSVSAIGRAEMPWLPSAARHAVRALLVVFRSIPEVVLALLFVRIAGPGPSAAVWAIALTYSAMLAKVFAEIVESGDDHASQALLNNGASRLGAFFYGVLPGCSTELVSYLIYRWECAIRGSVVMGFVGAGGLGQQIDTSVKMMAGHEVITILAVFVVLVACADWLSRLARKALDA